MLIHLICVLSLLNSHEDFCSGMHTVCDKGCDVVLWTGQLSQRDQIRSAAVSSPVVSYQLGTGFCHLVNV
jgi:hypothetical protein